MGSSSLSNQLVYLGQCSRSAVASPVKWQVDQGAVRQARKATKLSSAPLYSPALRHLARTPWRQVLAADYWSNLRKRTAGYWIRLAVLLFLGTLAASWIGNWGAWIDVRFKVYQFLQSTLPGKGPYVQNTAPQSSIQDEDYWKGDLDQRVPIKRDYLARVVRALDYDNAGIIVLKNFDLRSPIPTGLPAAQDKYWLDTRFYPSGQRLSQKTGS